MYCTGAHAIYGFGMQMLRQLMKGKFRLRIDVNKNLYWIFFLILTVSNVTWPNLTYWHGLSTLDIRRTACSRRSASYCMKILRCVMLWWIWTILLHRVRYLMLMRYVCAMGFCNIFRWPNTHQHARSSSKSSIRQLVVCELDVHTNFTNTFTIFLGKSVVHIRKQSTHDAPVFVL